MIKLVIFDWNGTLLADTAACMYADNKVIQAFGGTPVDITTYRATIIRPAINFYSQHGCNRKELINNPEKNGRVFHGNYEPRVDKVRSRRNAKALLQWLRNRKIQTAILSNHTVEGIQRQIERLGLKSLIGELVANSSKASTLINCDKQQKFIT